MKTIFKIHPFFYLFALLCIFTGYFKNFLMITFIIVFHELGHIIASKLFNWNIDKVVILPFGGITLFNGYINTPLIEELIVALMGPIFQIFLFLIDNDLFRLYNLNLLIFNLIPILPLDGSKILNILLNKLFSFKHSHIISIVISFISIFLFMFFRFNLILFIAIIFLLIKTIKELRLHRFLFNKFLFERYLYKFNFKKYKIIKKTSDMKRDYKHLFKTDKNYVSEKTLLKNLFDN